MNKNRNFVNRQSVCSQVLEKYYLDPKVLTAVEISALKVRFFGKK
jgi:hypothetical protein